MKESLAFDTVAVLNVPNLCRVLVGTALGTVSTYYLYVALRTVT